MKVKLIANPTSGGDSRPQIRRAQECLAQLGAKVELCQTRARGDARTAAEAEQTREIDRLVVLGGDGTLNEVVNGAPPDLPIAFLPRGTVNVFALEAGIPFDLEAGCRLAVEGTPRSISLGRINGEAFLLMASAGWDAEAVTGLRPNVKRWIGRAAYGLSALEALLRRAPRPVELVLPDGTVASGYGLVASNCRLYGGRYEVTPQASMFSDTLEVCLLRRPGRFAQLAFALHLLCRLPLRPPHYRLLSITAAELRGEGVAVQVDGDAWGRLPVRLQCDPGAVTMVLPNSPGGKLP